MMRMFLTFCAAFWMIVVGACATLGQDWELQRLSILGFLACAVYLIVLATRVPRAPRA